MGFVDLMVAAAAGGNTLYPSQIIQAIATDGNADATAQARALLSGFAAHQLMLAPGPFADSTSFLNACRVSFQGQQYAPAAGPVKTFMEFLQKLAAIVDGAVGEKEYRPGQKSDRFDNIAIKFVDDHAVPSKRDAEVHARKRLSESANVPASTSIAEASVKKLDTEVGRLNEKKVFAAVGEYVTVVASYLYGQDLIDGICYVTGFKVDGWIYTRGARSGQFNNDVKNGYLAYCVVANDAKAEQMLAYHYQDIVNAPDAVPRAKAGKAWRLVTFDDFRRKCPRTQLPTRAADWPIVYYAANA
jgi:hypothetical protein